MAHPNNDQLAALMRLYKEANSGSHSGARVCAMFLLGLYNGDRFPFDLTDLRRLDLGNFEAALQVLQMDYQPQHEVHIQIALLLGTQTREQNLVFENWAHFWKVKGRCKKEDLQYLKDRVAGKPHSESGVAA